MSVLVLLAATACASAQPPSAVAPESTTERVTRTGRSSPVKDEPPERDPADRRLPTTCADPSVSPCTPPFDFVERLCSKPRQDVALALFAPAVGFTRAYLRGRLDELGGDEEVLVLRFRAPQKEGIVVGSGKGTYDLLRWDGTCASGVEAEGITRVRPARPKNARIKWHRLPSPFQDVLIASSDAVKRARSKRGKECKGAMSGDVSAACEKADEALGTAVVDYVRSGGTLPSLADVP
ncbi:MAG: hypothetical protein ABSC94_19525 [Polyangiaceae bacterium]|jgi:hypothetical protein